MLKFFRKIDIWLLSISLFLIGFSLTASIPTGKSDTIHLFEMNTVVLSGPINEFTTQLVIAELLEKERLLKGTRTMYLVLNTPGGMVDEGERLINVIKTLKIDMKTITYQSYSEGFNIVQLLGERLILPGGSMMSHRVYTNLNDVAIPIPINSLLDSGQKKILKMYSRVAKRIGLNLNKYLDLIRSEYWVYDEDAVRDHVADRMVMVTCDTSLIKSGRCPLFSF